jgi:hypothetical protein
MKRVFESTFIYALLIFLGFYNYYSFYNFFDINIASFLTSGELLLSFLPLTIPIIGILIILTLFYIRTIVALSIVKSNESLASEKKRIPDLFIFGDSIKNLKVFFKDKTMKFSKYWLMIFLNIFGLILGFFFILFFIGYIFYFLLCLEGKYVVPLIPSLLIFGIFWFILFDELIDKVINNREVKDISRYFLLIVFVIVLIRISNENKAKELINGDNRANITFEYNNEIIKSDSNIVFVGKVERYLFLRNLKESQNIIYPADKLGMIKITNSKKK